MTDSATVRVWLGEEKEKKHHTESQRVKSTQTASSPDLRASDGPKVKTMNVKKCVAAFLQPRGERLSPPQRVGVCYVTPER